MLVVKYWGMDVYFQGHLTTVRFFGVFEMSINPSSEANCSRIFVWTHAGNGFLYLFPITWNIQREYLSYYASLYSLAEASHLPDSD